MSKTSATAPPATRTVRVALEGSIEPGHEALIVRDDACPFALVGRWAGGGALVGSEPVRVASPDEDPFALLAGDPDERSADVPAFVGGGWFGYLGFGIGAPGEAVAASPPGRERLPPFALARYDHLLRLDPAGRWWFEALWTPARAEVLGQRLEVLSARLRAGVDGPAPVTTAPWRADPSPAGHARAVQACRERIAAGDLYQANLALRLRSTIEGDPADLFAVGVAALAPDRAAYVAGEWGAVASLSPELFLERRGRRVRSAPIKGTRGRDASPASAAEARADLLASDKDRAENVMIVDLVRNDLGRVCVPGSVRVRALAEARPHPGVWHLVSEVEGELDPDVDDAALLTAAFPPGSVTGAPKLAALATIAELESNARQTFTGAVGFASPFAGLELSVAIRTFEVRGTDAWLDVGGGIVADSDPAEEAAEALVKARPLLTAIGATPAAAAGPSAGGPSPAGTSAAGPSAAGPTAGGSSAGDVPAADARPDAGDRLALAAPILRLGPRPLPRPDPRAGVFETLLVQDGRPVALDLHLARLAESMADLYGAGLAPDLAERIRQAAAAAGTDCRIRVSAAPDAQVAIETAPLPDGSDPVALAPVALPGGLGAHKWRDRRLLDALAAATAPATPLLVDLDGYVLEASFANVFLVDADGALVTPPLDGRILPGVTRQRVIRDAAALLPALVDGPGGAGTAGVGSGRRSSNRLDVVQRPVRLAELRAATQILVTSALRGMVPARVVS